MNAYEKIEKSLTPFEVTVAAQRAIPGFANQRVAIPSNYETDNKKGVKDSHFIGYYMWIFEKTGKGKIKLR